MKAGAEATHTYKSVEPPLIAGKGHMFFLGRFILSVSNNFLVVSVVAPRPPHKSPL
jgi:hypothetical protein